MLTMSSKTPRKHSWIIESENVSVKKTDKSFFIHRGTGIPADDIRSFFNADDVKPGKPKYITLFFEGEEFVGRITRESLHLARTRMFWVSWLSEKFNEKFNYSEKRKSDRNPYAVFEKISETAYNVYLRDASVKDEISGESDNPGPNEKRGSNRNINGTLYIGEKRSMTLREWPDPDVDLMSEEEREIRWKIENDYKRPRTSEELESILKQISEDQTLAIRKEKTCSVVSRNPTYARLVKERDGYICQICGALGFEKKGGGKYAEAHHIDELAKNLIDDPRKMICVCPLCHRIIHYGTNVEMGKREKLKV